MKKDHKTSITENPNEPWFACTACWPAILELGSIRDVGYLCYNKNIITGKRNEKFENETYVLILTAGQGHWDDEVIVTEKPVKVFCEDAQWNEYKPSSVTLSLDHGVHIHNAFLKHATKLELKRPWGWMVERWLAKNMSSVVERWEKKFGTTVEDYYRDFYAKRVVAYHKYQEQLNAPVPNDVLRTVGEKLKARIKSGEFTISPELGLQ